MGTTTALVPYSAGASFSLDAILRDLKVHWPDVPIPYDLVDHGETFGFCIASTSIACRQVAKPVRWEELGGLKPNGWLWPHAEKELAKQEGYLEMLISGEATSLERATMLTQAAAAVIGSCPEALGVFWMDAKLPIRAQIFRNFALKILPHGPPAHLWVDFRVEEKVDGRTAGFTTGLAALDLMEFETEDSFDSFDELRDRLIALSIYVLEHGPVISNGDTVGETDNERIRVNFSDSSFGADGTVMRLDFEQALEAKPWWKLW